MDPTKLTRIPSRLWRAAFGRRARPLVAGPGPAPRPPAADRGPAPRAPGRAAGDEPHRQLGEASAELVRRLRAGEPCRAEDFFRACPPLAGHADAALELIYTEFLTRLELGRQGAPEEWFARFPQWHDRLDRLFGIHDVLWASTGDGDATLRTGPAPAPAAPAGRPVFGRYQLLEEVGRGATGVVHRARQLAPLERVVALKALRDAGLADPEEVARFYQEARAAGGLRHAHIVPVHDVGEHDGTHYLAMAYVGGGSLAQHRGRFRDPRAAAGLVAKVARAVHHAHECGVLHRDLKPGNILLDEHDEPLVADFGLAKFVHADGGLTETGRVLGTPAYLSPEQAAGQSGRVTAAADVWSLGVVLYELLTGRQPFAAPTRGALLQQIAAAEPTRPRRLRRGLPRDLEAVCLRCLEKGPTRRYASAAALADDLERWLGGEPTAARPAGPVRRGWRAVRRHPYLCGAGAALALATAAALVVLPLLDPDKPLKDLQRQLDRGEPAVLVGDTGKPRWSRPAAGDANPLEAPGPGRFLALSTPRYSLLELLPDPRVEKYRFRAEVRHEDSQPRTGAVGIYLLHSRLPGVRGDEDCFCTLTFNDFLDQFPAPGTKQLVSQVTLEVFRVRADGKVRKSVPAGVHEYFVPAARLDPPQKLWRELAVDVTPEAVRVHWDGLFVGAVSRDRLQQRFQQILNRSTDEKDHDPGLEPAFAPRGGLGLYVRGGWASYRRVAVEPIK